MTLFESKIRTLVIYILVIFLPNILFLYKYYTSNSASDLK